jgi:hypothetical protein
MAGSRDGEREVCRFQEDEEPLAGTAMEEELALAEPTTKDGEPAARLPAIARLWASRWRWAGAGAYRPSRLRAPCSLSLTLRTRSPIEQVSYLGRGAAISAWNGVRAPEYPSPAVLPRVFFFSNQTPQTGALRFR